MTPVEKLEGQITLRQDAESNCVHSGRDTAKTHDKDKAKQADIPSAPDAAPEQSSHQGFAG